MNSDNQLHQQLIQEIKRYVIPSIYPKSKEEMLIFIRKSSMFIHYFYSDWEKPIGKEDMYLNITERINQELKLLRQFEKEQDPLMLIELAKLNFRYFCENNYIDMINFLRHICLTIKIWGLPEDNIALANYAKTILEKMVKVAIPKFKPGRLSAPLEDINKSYVVYKQRLNLYQQIKKEIIKSRYRNFQVLKSMLKRKYNVADDEIDDLKDFKPSEVAIEKIAKIMKRSIPWVKKQIKIGRLVENSIKAGQLKLNAVVINYIRQGKIEQIIEYIKSH